MEKFNVERNTLRHWVMKWVLKRLIALRNSWRRKYFY